jgi:hypothetical protein
MRPAPGRLRPVIWELFFMLVILKIPVVYLCAVVWWAVRAEPRPLEGAAQTVSASPSPPTCGWRDRLLATRRRPVRPRPGSGATASARAAYARARVRA